MSKIDFIGIATSKSATTSISRLLSEHPEICFSIPKELKYFNTYSSFRHKNQRNIRNKKEIDWIDRHFNHWKPDQIKGEFSPSYFIDPGAPENIFKFSPKIKLILALRNPVDRAFSAYQMAINVKREQDIGFKASYESNPEYIKKGMYYENLMRWLKYFKLEQMHFIIFDDFKKNPKVEIQKVYRFLGVNEDFVPPSLNRKFNYARRTKFVWIKKLERFIMYYLPSIGLGIVAMWLKTRNWLKYKRKIQNKPIHYKAMSEEDRNYLKEVFREDLTMLGNLLNRDFSSWLA